MHLPVGYDDIGGTGNDRLDEVADAVLRYWLSPSVLTTMSAPSSSARCHAVVKRSSRP